MNRGKRHIRALLALIGAFALVCVLAAPATAIRKIPTTATLTFNSPDNFSGEVSAKFAKCRAYRLVTLYFTGPSGNDSPSFVEAAQTDTSGHYEINAVGGARAGTYFIVVSKRVIRKLDTKCKPFTGPPQSF
jgi:hypothetical protein